MRKFKKIETGIEGLSIIEPTIIEDHRGFFMETYNKQDFVEIGIEENFVQDNHSKSIKGVLRGLSYQKEFSQGKLVRVIKGEVYDVAVDIRKKSPSYGKYYGVMLSEKNKKMFFIPKGFAHGFLVTSEEAEFMYKCTDFYYPEDEGGIIWNDPCIGIKWPLENIDGIENIIQSEKDKKNLSIKDLG